MFSILLGIGLLLSVVCVGYMLNLLMNYLPQQIQMGEPLTMFVPSLLFSPWTWILGTVFTLLAALFWFLMKGSNYKSTRKYMKGDSNDIVQGSLENSRFMTDAEKEKFFPGKT